MTRTEAARRLGISDKTLSNRLKKLDLSLQPKPRQPLSPETLSAIGLITQEHMSTYYTGERAVSSNSVEPEVPFLEADTQPVTEESIDTFPDPEVPPIAIAKSEIVNDSPFSEEFLKRKSKAVKADPKPIEKESIFPMWMVSTAATGLIISDSLCFFWIAYNAFDQFAIAAGLIFALAGLCVGFAAIKNTADYVGKYESEFLFGFMFFQILLHCCATQVFSDWSFFLGKIVISIGTAVATCGLAITLKRVTK